MWDCVARRESHIRVRTGAICFGTNIFTTRSYTEYLSYMAHTGLTEGKPAVAPTAAPHSRASAQ